MGWPKGAGRFHLQILAVADLLHDSPHALVRVDRVEQVDRGHRRGVLVLGGGNGCWSDSAAASAGKRTAGPSAIATRRISWSRSPVLAPNFEVRFISLR